jgi:glycine cleavage system transcriptional repressor
MKEYVVFSLLGSDRTGLVDRITQAIGAARGNLEDSRMAVLGGEFAMVMLCSVESGGTAALEAGVRTASDELGLLFTAKPTTARKSHSGTVPLSVQVRGMDHEGIVHDIVHYLVEHGVSVETLDSHVTNAPYSGVLLFSMNMRVEAPASLSLSTLRRNLEAVGDKLNVDVLVDPLQVTA